MPRCVFEILAKRTGTYNTVEGGHLIEGGLVNCFFNKQ